MSDIPEEAVKAAEGAFKRELELQGIRPTATWTEEITAALEAAMPHIREHIAQEVEDQATQSIREGDES